MFTRIFISFMAVLSVSLISSIFVLSPDTNLSPSRISILFIILICAAGLFWFFLSGALQQAKQEQKKGSSQTEELAQLKASLTASMSHELRTPLNAIIGFTGVILQGMSGEINRRQRDQLEKVLDSAKKLLSLITDIINIARIDAGNTELFPVAFSVNEAIREAIYRSECENHPAFSNAEINIGIPPALQLHTDQKKLTQCIINILICIMECTGIKNITITAHETDKHLGITIGTSREKVTYEQVTCLTNSLENGTRYNIRLHLTRKIISDLLGGDMSIIAKPGGRRLLQITFNLT